MIFDKYAAYYDLIYTDKDYSEEVNYVDKLICKYGLPEKSLLDLGCGTGRHDVLFAEKGYQVTGTDKSTEMINVAVEKASGNDIIEFIVADATSMQLDRVFSNVISLFHVSGYIGSNDNFKKYLKVAYDHLQKNGLFIFDFWHGPGVLADRPSVRIKKMENDKYAVRRIAQPELFENENKVVVNFEIFVTEKESEHTSIIYEKHEVRYFFYNNIRLILENQGFKIRCFHKWLAFSEPDNNTWYAVIVAVKK